MSFSLTKAQMRAGTKTVTRRLGWSNLKPGQRLLAVEQSMGLPLGARHVVIGEIEVVSAYREPLYAILPGELEEEGFPEMSCDQFIDLFCTANRCAPTTTVNVIRFRHVDPAEKGSGVR